MGVWSYGYNVLGELTSQTDALNQTIIMAYDELGRMTSRVLPNNEGTSQWTYDTAASGIGKLASVTNPNANETYTYDSLSRPSTHTTSIGGIPYTVTTAYDALGRVDTITYPETGFRLKHVYDPNQFGFLKEVRNDATGASYWKINVGGVDALNRIINETYGNGLISQRQYAAGTGDLNFIQTGTTASPTAVQNETYGFDELGNVTARRWWDGASIQTETFGYDPLNRLTTVTGPANKTYATPPTAISPPRPTSALMPTPRTASGRTRSAPSPAPSPPASPTTPTATCSRATVAPSPTPRSTSPPPSPRVAAPPRSPTTPASTASSRPIPAARRCISASCTNVSPAARPRRKSITSMPAPTSWASTTS